MNNNVSKSLNQLSKKDTYSLMMFVLFLMQDIPEIAPLSELVYLLDEQSLVRLLRYFGGQTITFPKVQDLQSLIHTLALYEEVEMNNGDFSSAFNKIPKEFKDPVLSIYNKVNSILEDYSFV